MPAKNSAEKGRRLIVGVTNYNVAKWILFFQHVLSTSRYDMICIDR